MKTQSIKARILASELAVRARLDALEQTTTDLYAAMSAEIAASLAVVDIEVEAATKGDLDAMRAEIASAEAAHQARTADIRARYRALLDAA